MRLLIAEDERNLNRIITTQLKNTVLTRETLEKNIWGYEYDD